VIHKPKATTVRRLIALLLALSFAPVIWEASSQAASEADVAERRGAMGLGQAIRKLGVVASVLHTGAHPDDEDSGLLAYLARGRQARTAYLSLTRGDGGQNVIGPELNEALGIIRTEELLAARRIDGADQFFARAFDFGFSKSRTETLAKWDREKVLADMVRVIRTFRPQVIASCWSGTPNDGHGHHQAAGFLTQEAYKAAADPQRFPELGLRPWQARKLYVRSFDGTASPREFLPSLATLAINTGQYDALLGRSYFEVAMEGRSQHRSQDAGAIEARGPRYSRLRLIDSKLGPIRNETDIFDGIDTSLLGIAAYAGAEADRLKAGLLEVQRAADEARQKYNPLTPQSIGAILAQGLQRLRQLSATLGPNGSGVETGQSGNAPLADAVFLLKQKEADFSDALAKSTGAVVDVLTDDEIATPGQTLTVTVSSYVDASAKILDSRISAPPDWTVVQSKQSGSTVDGRALSQTEFKVTVSGAAEPSSPYWLRQPRRGDMFDVAQGAAGAPTGIESVAKPVLSATVQFEAGGERFEVSRPAQFRFADGARGEVRRDLKVAPPVSVAASPEIIVYPLSNLVQQRDVTVSIVNNVKGGSRGSVRLAAPSGWLVTPSSFDFDLKREGERAAVTFAVRLPAAKNAERQFLTAVAAIGDREYRQGFEVIAYPHIESRFQFRQASTEADLIDVKVATPLKVGYIEGAGDDVADALRRLGVEVTVLDSNALAFGDLSGFDTIIAGVRAYEVRDDLVANNARLLDYVNRGGTYIVQYNRGNFETAGYGPYRFRPETPQRPRGEGEPRRLYVRDADIAGALSARDGKSPRVGVVGYSNAAILGEIKSRLPETRSIDAGELATGDLNQFDLLVIAPDARVEAFGLKEYNQRLLEFATRKLVILAYSQSQYQQGNFPEYPRPEARPFRTTDEEARVTILEPNHPRFNFPNKIADRDFEGWVQERGAYFLSQYDSRYKPLMSSHDPGEPDLKGGEVIAEYGKGFYVYTAYAWFRQLPKGVPGAYRLIANLVSLSKARGGASPGK
jgi:LmbE family N-acetylglucosaminyl deacetylase